MGEENIKLRSKATTPVIGLLGKSITSALTIAGILVMTICLSIPFVHTAPEECAMLIYTDVKAEPSIMRDTHGTCPENGGKRAFVLEKGTNSRQPKVTEASPTKGQRFGCVSEKTCKLLIAGAGLVTGDHVYLVVGDDEPCPPTRISTDANLVTSSKIIDVSTLTVFGALESRSNMTSVTLFDVPPLRAGKYSICYASNLALRSSPPMASDLHYFAGPLNVDSSVLLNCDFEGEMCVFKVFNDDSRELDLPWKLHSGPTYDPSIEPSHDNTPGTGPSFDHTKGEGKDGSYLYMKSPGFVAGATATIISPLFTYPSGTYCFKLFYHMYGDDVNSIRAYVRTIKDKFKERRNWGKPLFVRIGDHGDEWLEGGFEFLSNGIDPQQIIIEGLAGYSEKGDLALDDISINTGKCPPSVLQDSNRDFICGEVRLNTGNWSGEKSWYLEGAVSCAGRGYSFDQLQGGWQPCCVPNYGNYTVVLKDRFGDGWSGSQVQFKFFDEIFTFGEDFDVTAGSEKKYNLVVGLLQISRVEGKSGSIALEVTVMIPDSFVWCGAALEGSPAPTVDILKKYGIRAKNKATKVGDKIRLVIKNEEGERLALRPNQNYEVYCYAESAAANIVESESADYKMDDAQVLSSKVLVTTDGDPPQLEIHGIEPTMFDISVTFSVDEPATVWCYAAEQTSDSDTKKHTIAEIKTNGKKRKLQSSDVNSLQEILLKKLMPDTFYNVMCCAEDLAQPKPNVMPVESVRSLSKTIMTQAKVPKISIISYKTFARGFSIIVRADTPCVISCGAAMAGSPYPTKEDVRRVGATATVKDTSKNAELEVRGVPQNTRYTVYCIANSLNGNMEMSESDMIETAIEVTSFGKFCEIPTEPKTLSEGEATPFDPILPEEEFKVKEFITSKRELGFDGVYRTTLYINKDEIIDYLDNGGAFPKRYARVRAGRCVNGVGEFLQLKVGPLDATQMTYKEIGKPVITDCGGYTPQGVFGRRLLDVSHEEELSEMLKESFGYDFGIKKCKDESAKYKCLEFGPVVYEQDNDRGKLSYTWVGLRTPLGDIVPFYFIFKTDYADMSEPFKGNLKNHFTDYIKEIDAYWYNGDMFSTLENLLEAYRDGRIKVVRPENLIEKRIEAEIKIAEEKEVKARRLAPGLPGPDPTGRSGLEYRAAPEHSEPQGKRFTIKSSPGSECYTINYIGWEMTVMNDRDTSLRLYNIKFNGHRIAFEMGVMEALAHYTVAERNWFFLDSWYGGLGSAARPVRPGVECATTGITLFYDGSLCVFEMDLGRPIRSHWKAGELRDGAPHHALVLRQMLTVSNYDYVTDYYFHNSGAFQGTMSFTGELYAGVEIPWYSLRQHFFGTQVSSSMRMGGLHNHICAWKIDFDIGKYKSNSILWKEVTKDPLRFGAHKMDAWYAETESQGYWKHNDTRPLHYFVVDESHTVYGNVGGYVLLPQAHLHVPQEEYELYQGPASFALYKLLTSVYKENEIEASLPRDNKYPGRPAVDVDRYIEDDEVLRHRDVVTWISDGVWHVPLIEDMPLTLCLGNTLGWLSKPANFFTEDPSMDLHNAVAGDSQDPGTCAMMRSELKRG